MVKLYCADVIAGPKTDLFAGRHNIEYEAQRNKVSTCSDGFSDIFVSKLVISGARFSENVLQMHFASIVAAPRRPTPLLAVRHIIENKPTQNNSLTLFKWLLVNFYFQKEN